MTIAQICGLLHAVGTPVYFNRQAEAQGLLGGRDEYRLEIGVLLFRATAGIDPAALERDPQALEDPQAQAAWSGTPWRWRTRRLAASLGEVAGTCPQRPAQTFCQLQDRGERAWRSGAWSKAAHAQ